MKIITSLLAGLALAASSQADILTVDNNPGSVAQFDNFAAAYEAASEGDTILLAGSDTDYGVVTIHKRLHIVGPGYLLAENNVPGLARIPARISLDIISHPDPWSGESPSGTTIRGIWGSVYVYDHISGVFVEKCDLNEGTFSSPVVVRGCHGNVVQFTTPGSVVANSIFVHLSLDAPNINASHLVVTEYFTLHAGSQITNSVFGFPPSYTAAQFSAAAKGSVSYCLALGNYLPAGNGNLNSQLPASVFVNTGSDDAKWRLKAGSPAIGAGFNGVDIGLFGGAAPYTLSGIPAIPRITHLVVPTTATHESGLRFEVGAQAFGD